MKFNDVDDLKTEIRRQLKIKEGAENFKKATTDKKSLTQCNTILKEANSRLQELHHQLQDLNAGITDNPSGITYVVLDRKISVFKSRSTAKFPPNITPLLGVNLASRNALISLHFQMLNGLRICLRHVS